MIISSLTDTALCEVIILINKHPVFDYWLITGVDNPGPRYRPDSSYWGHGPKKSFGSSRKQSLPGPAGPGEKNQ